MPRIALLLLLLLLGACASPRTYVQTLAKPDADFTGYRRFAFFSPLGTDSNPGYTSILSQHLKAASREALETRGYVYDEQKPDLLVNFTARSQERTAVVPRPNTTYYRNRQGRYVPWTTYDETVIQYQQNTLTLDLIDARHKEVVWEGVAASQIRGLDDTLLESAARETVQEILSRYPYGASGR